MLFSQTSPNTYWVQFTGKARSGYSLSSPGDYLSERAILRRLRQNIPIDSLDLPVPEYYVDSLKRMGFTILNTSKWFNAVTIYITDSTLVHDKLHDISFIKQYSKSTPFNKSTLYDEGFSPVNLENMEENASLRNYGHARRQITLSNGDYLHQQGYWGDGMHVAVIDAGFSRVNVLPAFDSLYQNNRVLGAIDFTGTTHDVFKSHTHGTYVLSIMASTLPGRLIGTAPRAAYWLLQSEVGFYEHLVEEDNWVAAIEFADSAGVDVVNSSLGYTRFEFPENSHSYSDMDGNTARVSRAADIAASKGMVVVTSAGNSGNTTWRFISAPADADSVLAVGAVDSLGLITSFSSKGPSADGRIKPDVSAMGEAVAFQFIDSSIVRGNGTSFSSPVVAGLAACLWQAFPEASNMQVINAIKKGARRYNNPDNEYGYGIADFEVAFDILRFVFPERREYGDKENQMRVSPNPFHDELEIKLLELEEQEVNISFYDLMGRKIMEENFFVDYPFEKITINGFSNFNEGVYILKVEGKGINLSRKILKINGTR